MTTIDTQLIPPLSQNNPAHDEDKLLSRFREIATSGADTQDMTETEMKEAFEQELKQSGGRDALATLLQHITLAAPRCWAEVMPMQGSISFLGTKAEFNFQKVQKDGEIGLLYAIYGRFKGLFSGYNRSGRYELKIGLYYDDLPHGTHSARMYSKGTTFNVELYNQNRACLARIIGYDTSFTIDSPKYGEVTITE
ncbi:hypothetical protein BBP40_003139 [Aspergillus hancockii]|nr:hypothetical protein BBP40_003139 [Aspergillus hancockii]